MRRPVMRAAAVALAVVAVGAGCAGQSRPSAMYVTQAADAPALVSAPAPTTTIGLSQPIVIPDDPYAPEPVVQIGTIEIPKIGLVHSLFEGVTLHNIDNGPSHWTGTALPGHPGNAVFAAHRVTHDHPFRRIDELVPGDQVVFTVGGTRTTYVVSGHMVVDPSDTWIGQQTQAPTATLYACHPPGSAAHRYVVRMDLAT
jgi:sortase A